MSALTYVTLALASTLCGADEGKTVMGGLQGERPITFERGLATQYEGFVLAVLGTCSVDRVGTQEEWVKALRAGHLRVQYAKTREFAVTSEEEFVAADEIVVTISPSALPNAILVRHGKTYRAFGKYDPKVCFFIQEQLKGLGQ